MIRTYTRVRSPRKRRTTTSFAYHHVIVALVLSCYCCTIRITTTTYAFLVLPSSQPQALSSLHNCQYRPSFIDVVPEFSSSSSSNHAHPRRSFRKSNLYSSNANNVPEERRRKELLSRNGPYFALDRSTGKIEFGATANLVTPLPTDATNDVAYCSIDDWLMQPNVSRDIVYSIWDPKLVTEIDKNTFQLQIMTLRFVTITLRPTVNVRMETIQSSSTTTTSGSNSNSKPQFIVQSINFNPNLQLVPGMNFNAQSMGIVIEVVGLLQSSSSSISNNLVGTITFTTSGLLPLPLRIVPSNVLKATSNTINSTIMNVVVSNFQKSITQNYEQYRNNKKGKTQAIIGK